MIMHRVCCCLLMLTDCILHYILILHNGGGSGGFTISGAIVSCCNRNLFLFYSVFLESEIYKKNRPIVRR